MTRIAASELSQRTHRAGSTQIAPRKPQGLQGDELDAYDAEKSLNNRRYQGRAAHREGHSYILPTLTPTEMRKVIAAREAREARGVK